MERFLHLATENLSLRYRCTKCSTDLHLGKVICSDEKYLTFETVDNSFILDRPAITLRNLCGTFGSKLSLSCASCHAKIGCRTKKQYRIKVESVEVVLGEAAMEVPLADSAGEVKPETELQPESDQEPKSHLEAQIKAGPVDKVAEPNKTKEEGEGSKEKEPEKKAGTEIREVKEEEGEASGEVPPVMDAQNGVKEYETLKSEIRRLSKENDELKTRMEALSEREKERVKEEKKMEEQMLKGGARVVSILRKIEDLYREVERMKNMKKESEHALKKEKERNGCLVF